MSRAHTHTHVQHTHTRATHTHTQHTHTCNTRTHTCTYVHACIQDLQQQSELMFETKSILEQKNVSLSARAETAGNVPPMSSCLHVTLFSSDVLQSEVATLKVQLESLTQVLGVLACPSWSLLWVNHRFGLLLFRSVKWIARELKNFSVRMLSWR